MIESYFHKGEGYNPFLIREGWQVAQLNHVSGHGLDDIERMRSLFCSREMRYWLRLS